jgi:hypothetical protein
MMLGEWRVAIPFLRRSVYPVRRDSLHAVIPAKAGIQGKPYRREGAAVPTDADDPAKSGLQNRASPDE